MISFITRTLSVIMLIACLITLFAPVSLAQVEAETGVSTEDLYVVQQDDTLYELAGVRRSNPELWRQVVAVNPFLQEKGRLFDRNGKTIVLIRPGEKLVGLGRLGIVAERVPFDRLQPAPAPVPTPTPVPIDDSWPLWAWILIILLSLVVVVLAIVIFAIVTGNNAAKRLGIHVTDVDTDPLSNQNVAPRRARPLPPLELPNTETAANPEPYRHPAETGPAIVPGGVNDATASRQFMASAIRDYPELVVSHGIEAFRVSLVHPITITAGTLTVLYKDGTSRQITVDPEHPLRAYRGTITLPTGETQERFMLQACANDLRGSVSNYQLGSDVRWYSGHQSGLANETRSFTGTPEVAMTATESVSEAEQGAIQPADVITTSNFFDEMVKLGVLTEQDVQQAQASQFEPPYVITVDGDRTTVNGVAIVGARGIDLKGGNVCVILPQRGLEPAELHFSPSGEISGFPPTAQKSQTTNGGGIDKDDDLAMATVS